MRIRLLPKIFFICLLIVSQAADVDAQSRKKKKVKEPSREALGDLFTLRYKPQVGTLYYDVETTITHQLDGRPSFPIRSVGQLALETKNVDYKKNHWTYEFFFRELKTILSKHQLPGHDKDSTLNEVRAIGKRTRVTYNMVGSQVDNALMDSVKLSGEAQFFSYFFQPPRLLGPLPEDKASYGTTWRETKRDTVRFLDTVNIEQYANGISMYDVDYIYTFERLADSVDGSVAIISTKQEGKFSGMQYNPTGEIIRFSAPITGTDTTYLELRTGRVVFREAAWKMPVKVDADGRESTSDILTIRSTVRLNTSNIRSTGAAN